MVNPKLHFSTDYSISSIIYFLIGIALLAAQSWLIYGGVEVYGKFTSTYVLATVSVFVVIIYLLGKRKAQPLQFPSKKGPSPFIWALVSSVIAFLSYEELRKLFEWEYPNPGKYSDVVPQIEWLFTRFVNGEYPYVPLESFSWKPFPVYMPFHWLPVGITELFHLDSRWSGYILLLLVSGLAGYWIGKIKTGGLWKVLALALPHVGLWYFIIAKGMSMPVGFELPIMAYYLLLGLGLITGRNWIIILGLVCCILSRYTLFFWLPFFAILFWLNREKKESFRMWGIVFAAGVILYVLPFMTQDPMVLFKGIAYHNKAVTAEWAGYGDPPESYTHRGGIYFAGHFKEMLNGKEAAYQAKFVRFIQLSMMGILLLVGFLLTRVKQTWHWRHLSLAMLNLMVVTFYLFSPLTYHYYYLVVTILSAVLVMDLIPTLKAPHADPTE
ncbi:MAG: hypothetical protein AAGI38_03515 [Bacteroidota bacterium]